MSNPDGCAGYILCPECDEGYPAEGYVKSDELSGEMTCEECGTKFEWYAIYHYYTNLPEKEKRK